MSGTKDWKNEREDDRQVVLGLLCEVGAVKECSHHGGYYYAGPTGVKEAAEFVAQSVRTGRGNGLERYDPDELDALIEDVHSEHGTASHCSFPNCVGKLLGD